ncbi:serine hydrolase [Sphingomonas sp.]|uniref:serine hydrolase domain-containing protein n=1 Tax=Sphingomonas sp. TaxID=28214 RepID=UPI0025F09EA9|nr:serine hydrolase domain-containing protein [Sphingomonas sp.]
MMPTVSDPHELGFDGERLARIDELLATKYIGGGRIPHAALLIGRGDEVAHLSVMGDARAGEALQADAIFRIASMTKPITSIAFMQLVERGKVALSDPVAKFLPEFADIGVFVSGGGNTPFKTRPPASPMRMIDLLRHTSGLTYSFQERSNIDAAYRKAGFERFDGGTLDEMVAALGQLPIEFDPGSAWNYSVATDVLGAVVQRVSGQSLDAYFAEHILGPLAMVDTGFQVPADKLARVPDCYVWDPVTRMKLYDPGEGTAWGKAPKLLSGGGGLTSTIGDYHRFARMLLNGGELDGARIVAPHTLKLMTANHLPGGRDLTQMSKSLFSEAENAGAGFGLGFATVIDPAATMLPGNAGEFYWGGMFSTGFFVDPVDDVIMVFMTQLMPSNAYPVRRELKTMLYSALIG